MSSAFSLSVPNGSRCSKHFHVFVNYYSVWNKSITKFSYQFTTLRSGSEQYHFIAPEHWLHDCTNINNHCAVYSIKFRRLWWVSHVPRDKAANLKWPTLWATQINDPVLPRDLQALEGVHCIQELKVLCSDGVSENRNEPSSFRM